MKKNDIHRQFSLYLYIRLSLSLAHFFQHKKRREKQKHCRKSFVIDEEKDTKTT
jgi:hypothetical protein